MDPFTAMAGLSASRKLLVGILGPVLLLVAGFGSGVAFEHRGPQGFPLAALGKSLKVQRDDALVKLGRAEAEAAGWKANADKWVKFGSKCEQARSDENEAATAAVATDSAAARTSATRDFNSGYSAGRVAGIMEGRKACGAKQDGQAAADEPADPIADLIGGVRDDSDAGADDWNRSAYRPGG